MSFSFGTPSSAPANSSLTGGFSFGANKPATPGFGLTTTSQASTSLFGGTPASSAPAFGASTSFGAASTPAFGTGTNTSFGSTPAAPAFGAGNLSFGATSTAPTFGSTPAFGATSSAPTFGATSTAPTFGSTTTSAFGSTGLGGTTGLGGLNFGAGSNATTATTGVTLGAPATTSAGLGGFGTGVTLGAPATTSAGLGGFGGFGATTQTTSLFGGTTASGGLFGAKLGTTTMAGGLTTTTTPSLGLGGAAPLGATAASSDSKTEPPKQTKMPNEIVTTVDSFKDFVKKQKSISSEVMRVSVKPLYNVSREAECCLRAVLSLGSEVSRARAQSKRLRTAAAHALATAEAVHNAPEELESSAPPSYVNELIAELEQTLQAFRRQMDVADKQMQAAPKLLTEQELTLGIRRMHESLVALAGRLQVVHSQVDAQKEQYLNLRKYVLKDPTNVFEGPTRNTSLDQILRDAEGTRKKSKNSLWGNSLGSAVVADPRIALGSNIQTLAGPSPFSYVGTTLSPFPTTETTGPSWQAPQPSATTLAPTFNTSFAPQQTESTGFTLQKPPGKRGKQ